MPIDLEEGKRLAAATTMPRPWGKGSHMGYPDIAYGVWASNNAEPMIDEIERLRAQWGVAYKAARSLLAYLFVFGAGNPNELESLADKCNALETALPGEGGEMAGKATETEDSLARLCEQQTERIAQLSSTCKCALAYLVRCHRLDAMDCLKAALAPKGESDESETCK